MKRDEKIFNFAYNLIKGNDFKKAHVCIITSKGKIITYGVSKAHRNHDEKNGVYSVHAECEAIQNLTKLKIRPKRCCFLRFQNRISNKPALFKLLQYD